MRDDDDANQEVRTGGEHIVYLTVTRRLLPAALIFAFVVAAAAAHFTGNPAAGPETEDVFTALTLAAVAALILTFEGTEKSAAQQGPTKTKRR
jgi:hypothetical protein